MQHMGEALQELAKKYAAASVTAFEETERGYKVTTEDKGVFYFVDDFANLGENEIPLYAWRACRRFFEMANVLRIGGVEVPLAMRVKSLQQDEICKDLLAVVLREMDVCERVLLGDKVVQIFSAPDLKHAYMNALCATEKGIKISMEIGKAPTATGSVELHEVVCRTGIITDTACDTQVRQYPIYVYGEEQQETFVDTDYELYDMPEEKRDVVRYMLSVLASEDGGASICADYARQMKLAVKALEGGLCK